MTGLKISSDLPEPRREPSLVDKLAEEVALREYYTIEAMAKFGGSFVKALAEAARRADRFNLEKIKTTWPDYWKKYEEDGLEMRREDDLKQEEHKPDPF